MTRQELIAKLQSIRQMTTANGCSEAEAKTALRMLQRLMAEHQVAQSELDIKVEAQNCTTDEFTDISGKRGAWEQCVLEIGRLTGTKSWFAPREEDVLGLGFTQRVVHCRFFGLQTDTQAAVVLTAIIHAAMVTESERSGLRARDLPAFQAGMAERINERLRLMRETQKAEMHRASKGQLVVLKDQLVRAEYAKLGLRLSTRTSRTIRMNASAYAAGKAAGGRVDLGRNMQAQTAQRALPPAKA